MFRHRHRHELASAAMQYPSTSPLLQIAILPTSFKLQSKRSLDFAPLVNHRWRLQTIARVLTLLGHYNCMSASRTCCSVRSAINTCTRCSAKNTVAMRLAKNIVAIASHLLSQFLARPGCALVRGLHRPLIGVLLYAMDCDFARGGSRPRIA